MNSKDDSLLRNKSSWIPTPNRDRSLEDCIRRLYRLSDSLEDESLPTISPNLPSNQLHALAELRRLVKEKSLLITESDKGGYICLFDPTYIIFENEGPFFLASIISSKYYQYYKRRSTILFSHLFAHSSIKTAIP